MSDTEPTELQKAWKEFILQMSKLLRIEKILDWLSAKLKRGE